MLHAEHRFWWCVLLELSVIRAAMEVAGSIFDWFLLTKISGGCFSTRKITVELEGSLRTNFDKCCFSLFTAGLVMDCRVGLGDGPEIMTRIPYFSLFRIQVLASFCRGT